VIGDLTASDGTPPARDWALGHDRPVASIDLTLQWVTVHLFVPMVRPPAMDAARVPASAARPPDHIRIDKENDHDHPDIS
jgi:hypothetical protein